MERATVPRGGQRFGEPEERPAGRRTRRARDPIRAQMRFRVLQRDGFRCRYCGRPGGAPGVVLHVDHVVPLAARGCSTEDNLLTACEECNLGKSTTAVVQAGRYLRGSRTTVPESSSVTGSTAGGGVPRFRTHEIRSSIARQGTAFSERSRLGIGPKWPPSETRQTGARVGRREAAHEHVDWPLSTSSPRDRYSHLLARGTCHLARHSR